MTLGLSYPVFVFPVQLPVKKEKRLRTGIFRFLIKEGW
jgi:hypothetical protein